VLVLLGRTGLVTVLLPLLLRGVGVMLLLLLLMRWLLGKVVVLTAGRPLLVHVVRRRRLAVGVAVRATNTSSTMCSSVARHR